MGEGEGLVKCPKCGSPELKIEFQFAGQVACKFVDEDNFELIDNVAIDSKWDDDSPCECLSCQWNGTVHDAKMYRVDSKSDKTSRKARRSFSRPMTVEELTTLKTLLKTNHCPGPWRQRIEQLIAEVERLNSFVETLSRISEQDDSNGDTVVV